MKLHLSLKAEYFDAIAAGTKTEEFRLVSDYWTKRLHDRTGAPRVFSEIVLTWGYPPAPLGPSLARLRPEHHHASAFRTEFGGSVRYRGEAMKQP
ncbi:hypothetical protein ACVI3U_002814 [Sinorhizobium medicae]